MPTPITDLSGLQFGRLAVIRQSEIRIHTYVAWVCRCACGQEHVVSGRDLRIGSSRSCGCLRREIVTTHGHAPKSGKTSEYGTWRTMLNRCHNPNATGYQYWGGRGIQVCDRWRAFEHFIADMGRRPRGASLDRINNDGNYEPGNCRWASRAQQNSNRNYKRVLTLRGKAMTLTEWSDRLGIDKRTLWARMARGWSDERVLTQPKRHW